MQVADYRPNNYNINQKHKHISEMDNIYQMLQERLEEYKFSSKSVVVAMDNNKKYIRVLIKDELVENNKEISIFKFEPFISELSGKYCLGEVSLEYDYDIGDYFTIKVPSEITSENMDKIWSNILNETLEYGKLKGIDNVFSKFRVILQRI